MMSYKKLLQVPDTSSGKVVLFLSWLIFPLCHFGENRRMR